MAVRRCAPALRSCAGRQHARPPRSSGAGDGRVRSCGARRADRPGCRHSREGRGGPACARGCAQAAGARRGIGGRPSAGARGARGGAARRTQRLRGRARVARAFAVCARRRARQGLRDFSRSDRGGTGGHDAARPARSGARRARHARIRFPTTAIIATSSKPRSSRRWSSASLRLSASSRAPLPKRRRGSSARAREQLSRAHTSHEEMWHSASRCCSSASRRVTSKPAISSRRSSSRMQRGRRTSYACAACKWSMTPGTRGSWQAFARPRSRIATRPMLAPSSMSFVRSTSPRARFRRRRSRPRSISRA